MLLAPVAPPPLINGVGGHAALGQALASTDDVMGDLDGLAGAAPNQIRAGINTTAVGAATLKNNATIVRGLFSQLAIAATITGSIFAVMHRKRPRPISDLIAPRRPAIEVQEQLDTVKCFVMRVDQQGNVHVHALIEPGAGPYFHPTHNEYVMTRAEFDACYHVVYTLNPSPFLLRLQAVSATLPPIGAGAQFLGVPVPAPAPIPPVGMAALPVPPLMAALPVAAVLAPPVPAPIPGPALPAPPVPVPVPGPALPAAAAVAIPQGMLLQIVQTLLSNQGGHKSTATDNYDGKSRFPLAALL